MSGMLDNDEFRFECKRDERAAKELEEIQAIRNKWQGWVDYRKTEFAEAYDKEVQEFANKEAEREINELKENGNSKISNHNNSTSIITLAYSERFKS